MKGGSDTHTKKMKRNPPGKENGPAALRIVSEPVYALEMATSDPRQRNPNRSATDFILRCGCLWVESEVEFLMPFWLTCLSTKKTLGWLALSLHSIVCSQRDRNSQWAVDWIKVGSRVLRRHCFCQLLGCNSIWSHLPVVTVAAATPDAHTMGANSSVSFARQGAFNHDSDR